MSEIPRREQYRYFLPIQTRWMDNDLYGHVNNVTYYSYFDTVANHYLIQRGGLDIAAGEIVGVVVDSQCSYRSSLAYPEVIDAALRVDRLGNSSVQYGIAIFRQGQEQAAAHGRFVHVFVRRRDNAPVPIPDGIRAALSQILWSAEPGA